MEAYTIKKRYPIHRVIIDVHQSTVTVERDALIEMKNEHGDTVTISTLHPECCAEDSSGWERFLEANQGLDIIVEAVKNAQGTAEWGAVRRIQQAARKAEEAAQL